MIMSCAPRMQSGFAGSWPAVSDMYLTRLVLIYMTCAGCRPVLNDIYSTRRVQLYMAQGSTFGIARMPMAGKA